MKRTTVQISGTSVRCVLSKHLIRLASVDSAVKLVSDWNILVNGVQYYEPYGVISTSKSMYIIYLKIALHA